MHTAREEILDGLSRKDKEVNENREVKRCGAGGRGFCVYRRSLRGSMRNE